MKRPQYTEDFVIYKLSDFKPKEITIDPPRKKKPQSFYDNIRKNNIPIIIDYGSGYTKAVKLIKHFNSFEFLCKNQKIEKLLQI